MVRRTNPVVARAGYVSDKDCDPGRMPLFGLRDDLQSWLCPHRRSQAPEQTAQAVSGRAVPDRFTERAAQRPLLQDGGGPAE